MELFVVAERRNGLFMNECVANGTALALYAPCRTGGSKFRLIIARNMRGGGNDNALLVAASAHANPFARLGAGSRADGRPLTVSVGVWGVVLTGTKTKHGAHRRDQPYQNFTKILCTHGDTSRPNFYPKKYPNKLYHKILSSSMKISRLMPTIDKKSAAPKGTADHFFDYSFSTMLKDSSDRALGSAGAGQADISSEAFCTFGKAMTSRRLSAPHMTMAKRSRPIPEPP